MSLAVSLQYFIKKIDSIKFSFFIILVFSLFFICKFYIDPRQSKLRYYIKKRKFSLEYRRTDIFTIAFIQYLEFGIKNVVKKLI